jgi:PAS domain S-box-containing protein
MITSSRGTHYNMALEVVMTSLQHYQYLFESINDSVITRTIDGKISFWNRSAEQLYGWRKEEAIGRLSHDLLQTQFPKPLEEIESELIRHGRWDGKVVHTTRDGGRLVVESRWSLDINRQSGVVVEVNTPLADGELDHETRSDMHGAEIGKQERAFLSQETGNIRKALSNVQVRRPVSTAKKLMRTALTKAKRWLDEDGQQKAETATPDPPPIATAAKVLEYESRRPEYVWGVVQGSLLAQTLGIPRISVIELGVAGGNGLLALENVAEKTAEILGIEIDTYGFDTGVGLPKPTDYRDLPNLFSEGFFPMEAEKLRGRLKNATLKLGMVEQTIPKFIDSKPAPIAFVAFDLDLYSSTKQALQLFEADQKLLLPRVYCYFDDILGFSYSEFTGELLAISEFNDSHGMRKISKINGMRYVVPPKCHPHCWVEQFYMAHLFDHELYGKYDGSNPRTRLDLSAIMVSEFVRQAHDWMVLAR